MLLVGLPVLLITMLLLGGSVVRCGAGEAMLGILG